ncbi:hypothetical protein WSM22_46970 [Cytophagales bacterium WSM2-2]|nr:hypothetical protein WSM22_46970 [Cytophagales bacterium WSM2-2]
MGALGAALYYPAAFLLKKFPAFSDWHGDWVWPTVIMVGMLWSFGFCWGQWPGTMLLKSHLRNPLSMQFMLLRSGFGRWYSGMWR